MSTSNNLFIKLNLTIISGSLMWAALQAYIVHSFGFLWYTALTDSLIFTIPLGVACWLINNSLSYYQPGKGNYFNLLIGCIVLAGISTAASWGALIYIMPDGAYGSFLMQSLVLRFCIGFMAIGWIAMISVVWYTQLDQKENEQRKTEAEKLARDAELYNLRQQLQPHFLFNSLNSINALIGFKPDQARTMIHQLSEFLRGTLKRDDQQQTTLHEELQHLNLYLAIEKVRFGHRLQTEISCNDKCREAVMPSLLLQPVVENAIKFGLYDTIGEVTVSIRAELDKPNLILTIQNPFDLQTARPREGTGFGLRGLKRRLYLLFGRNDLVETYANDGIFTTIITVPQP
jgi:two-component system LytT family sensor kinase